MLYGGGRQLWVFFSKSMQGIVQSGGVQELKLLNIGLEMNGLDIFSAFWRIR